MLRKFGDDEGGCIGPFTAVFYFRMNMSGDPRLKACGDDGYFYLRDDSCFYGEGMTVVLSARDDGVLVIKIVVPESAKHLSGIS